MLALAIGLTLEPGAPPPLTRGLVFLGLISACRIGESLFPQHRRREKLTRTGAMHYLLAILTFTDAASSDLTPGLVKLYPKHGYLGMLDWLLAVKAALGSMEALGSPPEGRPEPRSYFDRCRPRPAIRDERRTDQPTPIGGTA